MRISHSKREVRFNTPYYYLSFTTTLYTNTIIFTRNHTSKAEHHIASKYYDTIPTLPCNLPIHHYHLYHQVRDHGHGHGHAAEDDGDGDYDDDDDDDDAE